MNLDFQIAEFVRKLNLPNHLKWVVCVKSRHCWAWQLRKNSYQKTLLKLSAKVVKTQIEDELTKCFDLRILMDPGLRACFSKLKIGKIAKNIQIIGGKHIYSLLRQPCEKDISDLLEIQTNLVDFGINSAYFLQATDYVQALAQVSGAF